MRQSEELDTLARVQHELKNTKLELTSESDLLARTKQVTLSLSIFTHYTHSWLTQELKRLKAENADAASELQQSKSALVQLRDEKLWQERELCSGDLDPTIECYYIIAHA